MIGHLVLSQLEAAPARLLRQVAGAAGAERLVDRILGERYAREIRQMLQQSIERDDRVSVVLIPGILGSLLASIRGITATLWMDPRLLVDGLLNLLDLNEDGIGDKAPDVEIVPVGIEKLAYLKLIVALARETRLYEFPYDWRRSLEHSAAQLRTSLRRWSEGKPGRRFVLIGHSMGGMVARTYMALYPDEAERYVERIVLLGSPLYGAPLATLAFTAKISTARVVAELHPNNDVPRFVSNLPSVYQLLPPPPELFAPDRDYPVNWDLYDAKAWDVPLVRQDYLDLARAWHQRMARFDPQVPIIQIAGCHCRTVTDVWKADDLDEIEIETDKEDDFPHYVLAYRESGEDSGDEHVPLWSVRGRGVEVYYIQESHRLLPSNTQVLDAVLELVHGGQPALQRELPEYVPPVRVRLQQVPFVQQVAELRQRIEGGGFSREDLERLFFVR